MRIALIALLIAAAAASGFFVGRRGAREAPSAADAAEDADASPHRVAVARVRRAPLTKLIAVAGTVAATAPRVVASPIDAEVARLPRPVGARVAQGDVVAELVPTPATRAARTEALANEAASTQTLAVVEQRLAAGLATIGDRQQAEQAAVAARRIADDWRARLPGDTVALAAPAPGVVLAVSAAPGQWVAAGTELLKLTGERVARFGLEPQDAAAVVRGSTMAVRAPRRADLPALELRIGDVAGVVDPDSHFVDAIAALADDEPFAIGDALVAQIPIAVPTSLVVPRDAIDPAQGGADGGIFVVADGHAHLHSIAIIAAAGDDVAFVADGVSENDAVAVGAVHALVDGDAVESAVSSEAAPADAAPETPVRP